MKKAKGKKLINRIAISNNKNNRSRAILIMCSIFLSTVLLTMISSYGFGLVKYEKASAASVYGSYYGMFSGVDETQLEAIENHEDITDVGISRSCGWVDSKDDISLGSFDDMAKEMGAFDERLEVGHYPEKADEIAGSAGAFKAAGYENVKLGDKITLPIRTDLQSAFEYRKFTVSGIQKNSAADEEGISTDNYGMVVSEAFADLFLNPDDPCTVLFRLDENVEIDSEIAEDVITGVADDCGISKNRVAVNTLYIMFALEPSSEIVVVCVGLTICVILFSMIVIYNIFQVSLVQRMHEYGRIKAVGATGRQLKRLISREGMLLALPAVPLGALVGYIAAYISFVWLEGTVKMLQDKSDLQFTFFSPEAVLGSTVLAFVTVWLAMIKPKRSIAKVSAIEAITYREGIQKKASKKSGMRKGSESINEIKLAFANIASGKKQAVLTMVTMGLSCVMFVVMANCLGNIDTDFEARKSVAHGQFEIAFEYTFYDEVYPENNLDYILKDNPLDDSFIQELKDIDGVTDVSARDILVMDRGGQLDSIEVLNREDFEKEKIEGADVGNPDYDEASEEDQLIFGWSSFMDDMNIDSGDVIDYAVYNGSEKKSISSEVGGAFGNCNGGWAITEDTYRHMGFKLGESVGTVWVDCSEKDVEEVEERIQQIMSSREHLELESFEQNQREQEFGAMVIRSAIYSLLAVIGIIGFANLANTMIINITTRRREYGIMQAVGMTGKQLGRSLSYQGLVYICGTIVVSALVGIPMGYATFKWCKNSAFFGMNVYHFPGLELIIMTAVLVAMQLALSWLLSRNLKRESLVDRIRY